jgi:hypothetical protein
VDAFEEIMQLVLESEFEVPHVDSYEIKGAVGNRFINPFLAEFFPLTNGF